MKDDATGAVVPDDLVERLARALHERYRSSQAGRKPPGDPALLPWEDLAEPLRSSSRSLARDIPRKLAAVGCRVVDRDGASASAGFTPAELEVLAEREHERWVAERRAAGWTPGPVRDPERKVTPFLVEWEKLPEDAKEIDRQMVRAIPEVLAQAGLGIRREPPGDRPGP